MFEAHPYTGEIESDEQLVAAARYFARNPVKAGLVDDPVDWPWSSARTHLGLERARIPLVEGDLRAAFGGRDWRHSYHQQIQRPDELELAA